MKKIVFLTGTRADYGKLKSLMKILSNDKNFKVLIFATGMHMLSKYGATYSEIEKDGFINIYKFINQKETSHMDITLSNTILGFSNYVSEIKPDAIVVHGDRLEALAGAIVGAFNNIKVLHIEGGEISGTIDESIRHAITKFSHFHFVANNEAKKRIIQLGEREDNIFIFGSPDIDIMASNTLPSIETVKKYYDIEFNEYSIFMYHPVTTELDQLEDNIKNVLNALIKSGEKYVVIYPNNDEGNGIILEAYNKLITNDNFKIFPSMKFEYFVSLLKSSKMIIGNSSSGIREAGFYGVPAIDLGNRQKGRYNLDNNANIIHIDENEDHILEQISVIEQYRTAPNENFGNGNSDMIFLEILKSNVIWEKSVQKHFVDVEF